MELGKNLENLRPKEVKFGLIAIDPEQEGSMKDILHLCVYHEPPTMEDLISLRKELQENPQFGLTHIAHRIEFLAAPDDVLQSFIDSIK
jgi:hypothetical protein